MNTRWYVNWKKNIYKWDAWIREGKWLTASCSKVKLKVKRRGSRAHNSKKKEISFENKKWERKLRKMKRQCGRSWRSMRKTEDGDSRLHIFFFSLFPAWAMSLPCPGHVRSFKKKKAATRMQPCHTRVLCPVHVRHEYSTQNAMSVLSSLRA